MRATRRALHTRLPHTNHNARIGTHYMPRSAQYAFGGHHAVRSWYDDPSLDWVPMERIAAHPDSSLVAIVEFEPQGTPQAAIVEPAAMRAYIAAHRSASAEDWDRALMMVNRAEALQLDDAARVFRGLVSGLKSHALLGLGRYDEADREARRACALFHANVSANYVLGYTAFMRGQFDEAAVHADSALSWEPSSEAARALKLAVAQAKQQQGQP